MCWTYLGRNIMRTHGLCMIKLENTSVIRLMAFDRENINLFLGTLAERGTCSILFYRIRCIQCRQNWRVHCSNRGSENHFTKRKSCVIKISSSERGINVTAVCCVNSLGKVIPLAFLYSRVRDSDKYLINALSGSIALGNKSG